MAIEYTNNAKAAHPRYARPVRDESRPEKSAVSAKTSQGDSSPKDKSMQPRQDVPTRGGGGLAPKQESTAQERVKSYPGKTRLQKAYTASVERGKKLRGKQQANDQNASKSDGSQDTTGTPQQQIAARKRGGASHDNQPWRQLEALHTLRRDAADEVGRKRCVCARVSEYVSLCVCLHARARTHTHTHTLWGLGSQCLQPGHRIL